MKTSSACHIGALMARLSRPICQKMGIVKASLLLDWPLIVGAPLADSCEPVKLVFLPKCKTKGTLHLRTSGAMAVELTYLQPLIVEKINHYFGYEVVAKLIFHHYSFNRNRKHSSQLSLKHLPLAEVEHVLHQVSGIADIPDPSLRQALLQLGAYVLRK